MAPPIKLPASLAEAQQMAQDQPALVGIAVLAGLIVLLLLFKSGGASKPAAKKRELRGYKRAEVYDVSAYVDDHPGGDAIFAHAGGDVTAGFLGIQHPPTVYDLVRQYEIGWLED
eukprot:scaffold7.g3736.t1